MCVICVNGGPSEMGHIGPLWTAVVTRLLDGMGTQQSLNSTLHFTDEVLELMQGQMTCSRDS